LKDLFVGLDLGGTWLKYGVAGADGKLLARGKKPSHGQESREVIFGVMEEAVAEMKAATADVGQLRAIGVGSPGIVDYEQGKLVGGAPNLPHWEGADIRGELGRRTGLKVYADNDANVMALAETRLGAGRGARNAIFLTLGTGIGGGILIDGELYRGSWFAGAELGHVPIKFDGRKCNCGNVGCIEQYASAPGIIQTYRELCEAAGRTCPDEVTTEHIFGVADEDKEAAETIRLTAYYLGVALSGFTNVFNPEVIVIGGGVAEAGDAFIRKVEDETKKLAMRESASRLRVVRAQMGNEAGTVGAILLAAEGYAKEKEGRA